MSILKSPWSYIPVPGVKASNGSELRISPMYIGSVGPSGSRGGPEDWLVCANPSIGSSRLFDGWSGVIYVIWPVPSFPRSVASSSTF
jgi:hypothetical protein